MKYMLLLYVDEAEGKARSREEWGKAMDQMFAYEEALTKAGALVEASPLSWSDEACTIRMEKGDLKVQDGPYAESREQFGGYFIIEVPDMDAARKWAARCPAVSWGAIEIRPMRKPEDFTA